jgi:ADP-ribose pyrophosphatase YjhB (NUDIX family)
MNFCSSCGGGLRFEIPEGDDHKRFICNGCETVHYQNPRMIVGTMPLWEDKVLLCKRAIAPRDGMWTLPAGFLENGESAEAGALRETHEEAGAEVGELKLFSVFSVPHVNMVYLIYKTPLLKLTFKPNFETSEVRLFESNEIPWTELSFRAVEFALQQFVDRPEDSHEVYTGQSDWTPSDPWLLGEKEGKKS